MHNTISLVNAYNLLFFEIYRILYKDHKLIKYFGLREAIIVLQSSGRTFNSILLPRPKLLFL